MLITKKVRAILIKDRKILVGQFDGKDFFAAPGFNIEHHENPREVVVRELPKSLGIKIKNSDLKGLGRFSTRGAGENAIRFLIDFYLIKSYSGKLDPHGTTKKTMWINSNPPNNVKIGRIIEHKILQILKNKNLID